MKRVKSSLTTQRVILLAVIINFAFSIFAFVRQPNSSGKVAYVDSKKLLTEYLGMIEIRKNLEGKSLQWQSNLDTLKSEYEKLNSDYRQTKQKNAKEVNTALENAIDSKYQEVVKYEQYVKDVITKEDAASTKRVVASINAYIKGYGQTNGYEIIFAATQYGNIAYADNAVDLTEEILDGLNKAYKQNLR